MLKRSLVLRPSGALGGYSVAIEDRAGVALGSCDAGGVVRDNSGQVVLYAPLRWHGRRDQVRNASIEVADLHGTPRGAVRLVSWGIGPRSRKATVVAVDTHGAEAVRIEPSDDRGELLALAVDTVPAGSIAVTEVKLGFLRRARVFTLDLAPDAPPARRVLVLAAALGYDVLLNAVVSASRR